mmetsp:Transcript_4121/g.7090  ORF Transcript_4121/g.7090 Transcript_4121/m.7090 type:complete len:228 (+) Transcript_4121:2490-3173(+)
MTIVEGHLWIPLVLFLGCCEAVADSQTGEIQHLGIIGGELLVVDIDAMSNGGSVVATVGFTNNVERVAAVLGIGLEELLQEPIGILRYHLFVLVGCLAVGKAHSGWLIQPQHVTSLRPGVWIETGCLAVLIDFTRTIFSQESQAAAASWTSSQPNNERDGCIANINITAAFLKHPVKEVFVFAILVIFAVRNGDISTLAIDITKIIIERLLGQDHLRQQTLAVRGGR